MRRFAALLMIWVLIGLHPLTHRAAPRWNLSQGITAQRLALDSDRPGWRTVGDVDVAEAWWIRSTNSGFGGYSALSMIGDRRFLLASDTGMVAGLTLHTNGRIDRPFIAPFPGGPGRGPYKTDRDLEAMTSDPVSGRVWTAYEHSNQIWRYGRALSRAERHVVPPAMALWNANGGAEAMARLADGRFLVMAESALIGDLGTAALLFAGDPVEPSTPRPLRFAYDAQGMGKITDAVQLPDGRILLLHRRLSLTQGFVSTLALADAGAIRSGRAWRARRIAEFVPPGITENFEGLAVDDRDGTLSIWMVSDDNLNRWQRTLLLRLVIPRDAANPPAATPGFAALP